MVLLNTRRIISVLIYTRGLISGISTRSYIFSPAQPLGWLDHCCSIQEANLEFDFLHEEERPSVTAWIK